MTQKSVAAVLLCLFFKGAMATVIPVTNPNIIAGLSPYNWVSKDGHISLSVCGASLILKFRGTTQVALRVDTDHFGI